MNKRSLIKIMIILILAFVFIFSLSACAPQKRPLLKRNSQQQEEKKPPKELDELRDSIEKIEKSLQSLHEKGKMPYTLLEEEATKKLQEEQKKQGGGSEGGGVSSEGGQGGQGGNTQNKPTQEEIKKVLEQEQLKKVEDIKKDILELHNAWSQYEPKAVADLAPPASITEFENALNNLTKVIENNDVFSSLLEVNELYKALPDFYILYKTKAPPEIDRIRYGVKKIRLTSEMKDYEKANETMKYMDSIWTLTKPKLKKESMAEMNKLEFAINDLREALAKQDFAIIDAKSEVILKIADDIEKAAEKQN